MMKGIIKNQGVVFLLCCINMIDDRWKRDERGKRTPIYNNDVILVDRMKRSDLVDVTLKFLGIDVYFPSFGYVENAVMGYTSGKGSV